MNWEHGNGMAYNPNTNEIYVALYTNLIPENRGCLYVMDPQTLAYKRKIKVSDDYNILGIDYKEDTNQYVIQTNADGGYSFKILDADFHVVEDLGSYAATAKGDNFQDLVVDGDYIINFPLTLNMGIGDYLHVYSISRKTMVADPQVNFNFQNITADEPEALCEIEPGVYLAAVNVTDSAGAKKLRLYRTEIPYYFHITVIDGDGSVIEEQQVSRGENLRWTVHRKKGISYLAYLWMARKKTYRNMKRVMCLRISKRIQQFRCILKRYLSQYPRQLRRKKVERLRQNFLLKRFP